MLVEKTMILNVFCLFSTLNLVAICILQQTSLILSQQLITTTTTTTTTSTSASTTTTATIIPALTTLDQNINQFNLTQLLLIKFYHLFRSQNFNETLSILTSEDDQQQQQQQQQSTLETRKIEQQQDSRQQQQQLQTNQELQGKHHQSEEFYKRNYFKILNRVFSRVDLPELYKTSKFRGGHCGLHIGCIEEIPNFPSLLRKANVTSSFTIYTRENAKIGQKILFEPIIHHQLQDATNATESELREKIKLSTPNNTGINAGKPLTTTTTTAGNAQSSNGQTNVNNLHNNNNKRQTATSWRTAAKIIHSQEFPFDLAAIEQSNFNNSLTTRIIVGGYFAKEDEEWIDEVVKQWLLLEPSNIIKVSWAESNRGLYHSAAYNSRIVGRQLTLFLYYLDQMFHINLDKFHLVGHSLGAHIAGFVGSDNDGKIARITGLDPAGPIFVELNTSMRLDPSDAKFVDVVHTNGGSITKGALGLSIPSGHVDYYCNGGSIQPGCYFSSVTKSILDPVERVACNHRRSYRYFIEIIKLTISESNNSNTINYNNVQYYYNNNNSINNMISPITTNYYSINGSTSTKLAQTISNTSQLMMRKRDLSQDCSQKIGNNKYQSCLNQLYSGKIPSSLPRAFLFEAKQDDLVKLMQPEIVLMSNKESLRREIQDLAPLKRQLEFHLLNPVFPTGKRGLYFFRTRSESPFFASKQFALTLKTDSVIRRKIALMVKIDQQLVAEVELDEIPGDYTVAFAPNDPRIFNLVDGGDNVRVPQLSVMWRHRSFNLLLNQQNELRLNGLELSLLDFDDEQQNDNDYINNDYINNNDNRPPVIKYSPLGSSSISSSSSNGQLILSNQPTRVGSGLNLGLGLGLSFNNGPEMFSLMRNQWYKFEGRLVSRTTNSRSI